MTTSFSPLKDTVELRLRKPATLMARMPLLFHHQLGLVSIGWSWAPRLMLVVVLRVLNSVAPLHPQVNVRMEGTVPLSIIIQLLTIGISHKAMTVSTFRTPMEPPSASTSQGAVTFAVPALPTPGRIPRRFAPSSSQDPSSQSNYEFSQSQYRRRKKREATRLRQKEARR